MNRNTAKQGIISPIAIREYRKAHPVRMKIGDNNTSVYRKSGSAGDSSTESRRNKSLGPLPHDSDANYTYGMPTRFFINCVFTRQ